MTDIPETDIEYDPNLPIEIESERPYQQVLTAKEIEALMDYQLYETMIDEGIAEREKGELRQLEGAYLIWSKGLWKYALSQVSQRRFRSQEQWIYECIESHNGITAFSRTNFFDKVRIISASLSTSVPMEIALRAGLNHGAIEEAEMAGAIKITATKTNKRTDYVLTSTPLGDDKLLKGGLKTVPELVTDIASMNNRQALQMVRHDLGKTYGYYSAVIPYTGDTPFFDESKARVFAIEYTFVDPANGSTPYQMKLLVEGDMDDAKVQMALRVLKGEFRL